MPKAQLSLIYLDDLHGHTKGNSNAKKNGHVVRKQKKENRVWLVWWEVQSSRLVAAALA
jgi:hypothetical protein